MINKLKKIYNEFPRRYWMVVTVSFIDSIGATLLFPFFSLYLTSKFGVGMTQAGVILGIFAISGLFGGMVGGALTDKFGRRKLILFGLIFSALSTLTLGSVNQFSFLYPLAIIIGLLSDVAGPAHAAMIADILPEEQRQEGFGMLRVVRNLAWIIGPSIGGFIANRSFFALFVIDAVISCFVAYLFFRLIPETKPENAQEETKQSILQSFIGYKLVIKDRNYMAFLFAGILMGLVYQQMYNSLSVYLRDEHRISPQGYGFLLTTSAITVIIFQFWVTRKIKSRPPFLLMALGTIFYAIGFTMFGVVYAYWLFALAIVIITIGEMIIMPTSQTLAANFAPVELRGRYMAIFGLIWMLPATVGPSAAGLILDNLNPNWLWYLGGLLCLISTASYLTLHASVGKQKRFQVIHESKLKPLEEG